MLPCCDLWLQLLNHELGPFIYCSVFLYAQLIKFNLAVFWLFPNSWVLFKPSFIQITSSTHFFLNLFLDYLRTPVLLSQEQELASPWDYTLPSFPISCEALLLSSPPSIRRVYLVLRSSWEAALELERYVLDGDLLLCVAAKPFLAASKTSWQPHHSHCSAGPGPSREHPKHRGFLRFTILYLFGLHPWYIWT